MRLENVYLQHGALGIFGNAGVLQEGVSALASFDGPCAVMVLLMTRQSGILLLLSQIDVVN